MLLARQILNLQKSSVILSSNVPQHVKLELVSHVHIPKARNPGPYLGTPSFWRMTKYEAIGYIGDRIIGKLQVWKQKLPSQGGKEGFVCELFEVV